MVDTADRLAIDAERTLAFGTNARVHHLNYFSQAETIGFIGHAIQV